MFIVVSYKEFFHDTKASREHLLTLSCVILSIAFQQADKAHFQPILLSFYCKDTFLRVAAIEVTLKKWGEHTVMTTHWTEWKRMCNVCPLQHSSDHVGGLRLDASQSETPSKNYNRGLFFLRACTKTDRLCGRKLKDPNKYGCISRGENPQPAWAVTRLCIGFIGGTMNDWENLLTEGEIARYRKWCRGTPLTPA